MLVAEDDATLREEVTRLLVADGHTVRLAADGTEAIAILEREEFELALVDWNMPGKGGAEVLRRAREIRPRTPVIVMTAYGSVETAIEAMRSGAKDFLQKPFEVESLEKTIESIRDELEARPKTTSAAATATKPPSVRRPLEAPSMKAAFLHSKAGLLIASKVREGQKTADEDLIVATLDVIQNFMRVSFPILRGKQLRAIVQGDYTLVTEAGKHTFLTAMLRGAETRVVRGRMRSALRSFEETNKAVLSQASSFVDDMRGGDEVLARLLAEST